MLRILTLAGGVLLLAFLAACDARTPDSDMNAIAERYVRLVLAIGEHDPNYVDAYHGPAEWREQVRAEKASLDELLEDARNALEAVLATEEPDDEMLALRRKYLAEQLAAAAAYIEMLDGRKMPFDAEAKALYGVTPLHHSVADIEALLREIETLLPGDAPLAERVETFRARFAVPRERLPEVFQTALQECRTRTLLHVPLPVRERFRIEYVNDKPWSGYNWYEGDSHSLIQVNTDLPIFLDRAVELGCHEGYPGHHVYNTLLESELVDKRGWMEFSIYALFSPQSLIAEGSANYGVELAFPGDEQLAFERDVLAPLAGVDTAALAAYATLRRVLRDLDFYAGNHAARAYLDGEMTRAQAEDFLVRHALYSPERAAQRVRFFDTYRSYVINYNVGRERVRAYVESNAADHATRWQVFAELLGSPRLLVEGQQ